MKKAFFRAYIAYKKNFPFSFGKGFLGRLAARDGTGAVYDIDGVKMELNPVAVLDWLLIEDGEINERLSAEMDRVLKEDDYFLDIGANIGHFSLKAARKYRANVLAFEPSPRELRRLYRNIALNHESRITVFPYALAAGEGRQYLHLAGSDNPSMNFVTATGAANAVAISLHPIRHLVPGEILRRVSLCKIDVEGFEFEVLKGFGDSMQHLRDCVFVVEVTPEYLSRAGASVDAIYGFFEEHGFAGKFGRSDEPQWDEVFALSRPEPA